jgi:hypothetical protein
LDLGIQVKHWNWRTFFIRYWKKIQKVMPGVRIFGFSFSGLCTNSMIMGQRYPAYTASHSIEGLKNYDVYINKWRSKKDFSILLLKRARTFTMLNV